MAIRGIDHIDLAVTDVDRYLGMLGLAVEGRFRTYRGTEDVVYLGFGYKHVPGAQPETRLGLRKADGGEHRYFDVGIEHLAFTVDDSSEVDDAYQRCLEMGARIHCPPEEDLPAKDFDVSKRFYEALGFAKVLDDEVAIFRIGAGGFVLQKPLPRRLGRELHDATHGGRP